MVRGIPVYSHCEHHLAPFFGKATVGYLPNGKIVGLSKLTRVRSGPHVRRQDHPLDGAGDRRDSRRREKQIAYNLAHGVDPQPLRKKIADITDLLDREDADTEALLGSGRSQSRGKARGGAGGRGALAADVAVSSGRLAEMPAADLANLIQELTTQMHQAAADLHFELAARLRDELGDLKKELRQMTAATS